MNKIGLLTLLIMASLVFTLAYPASAAGPKAPLPAVPAVAAAPAVAPTPAPPHPHIHAGLEAMRAAKRHLEQAAHDYEGHRVKAIEHLDAAIREAEICESMR
jgi:hypothetical protein